MYPRRQPSSVVFQTGGGETETGGGVPSSLVFQTWHPGGGGASDPGSVYGLQYNTSLENSGSYPFATP